MNPIFRPQLASIAIVVSLSTLAGCQLPAVSPGQANQLIKAAAAYASVGLKMLDDAGVETGLDQSLISKLMIDGKDVEATFDADGNLQVPATEAGGEQLVEVVLKDGQKVTVPVKAKKGEKFDAFLMAGFKEGEFIAEVGARGAKPMDVFKDKTVLFEIGEPQLTNETARALFIGPFKTPRQSWFTENGNLRLHGSNLWVLMQAKGGGMQPPGGQQQPGGMQQPGGQQQPGGMQPPPGGMQPPPTNAPQPPMFAISQMTQPTPPPGGVMSPPPGGMQPPPPGGMQPPPPGGMQSPPPGGMQPMPVGAQPMPAGAGAGDRAVVLRVVAELNGKFKVWAFTAKEGVRLPGPPPAPEAGKQPMFKDLPTLKKDDFTVETKEFDSLEAIETAIGKKSGNFLPPRPPMRAPGGGGMQPPPGGQQPPAGPQPPR